MVPSGAELLPMWRRGKTARETIRNPTETHGNYRKPAGKEQKPAGNHGKPAGNHRKPAGDHRQPSGPSTQPIYAAAHRKPNRQHRKPEGTCRKPAGNTQGTRRPHTGNLCRKPREILETCKKNKETCRETRRKPFLRGKKKPRGNRETCGESRRLTAHLNRRPADTQRMTPGTRRKPAGNKQETRRPPLKKHWRETSWKPRNLQGNRKIYSSPTQTSGGSPADNTGNQKETRRKHTGNPQATTGNLCRKPNGTLETCRKPYQCTVHIPLPIYKAKGHVCFYQEHPKINGLILYHTLFTSHTANVNGVYMPVVLFFASHHTDARSIDMMSALLFT